MKTNNKHADELKVLQKKLSKDHKSTPMEKVEPIKALVRSAMSFDIADARAEEAMDMIAEVFVDLNELRVGTDLEIAELLGNKYPDIEHRVEIITRSLNAIFEKEHTLKLERLSTLGKREIRQFLRELLPDTHPFVEGYLMLYCFEGAAIPVDKSIVNYLVSHGVFDEAIDLHEAQKFLEHHVKGEDCHDFFQAIRAAALHEQDSKSKKKSK